MNVFSGTALIEHWDGSAWARIRPRLPAAVSLLTDVAAVSGRDAWAVGLLRNNQTLTLRWDGTAWHRVPSPCTRECELAAVAAASGRDVWAAGSASQKPLTLHWDGKAWRRVPAPAAGGGYLIGLTAVSARDLWAVGHTDLNAITGNAAIIIEHWTGLAWH